MKNKVERPKPDWELSNEAILRIAVESLRLWPKLNRDYDVPYEVIHKMREGVGLLLNHIDYVESKIPGNTREYID